ncbi:MAG: ABC transporter ATP-binding protein, partial [Oscillospiraceae bacterium]|nr:ABC transporter ATP-binding protein [Oscillospiraceae bacterium]
MKLYVENLQKSFAKKAVLTGASYCFEKGKIYGLLGRNGAGKTTMFNCLADNIPLDDGGSAMEFDGVRRDTTIDDVGFVFTQPHLPEFMTGYEFIKYFVDINKNKIQGPVDIDASFALLDFDRADSHKLIKEYSHGMQTKVQLLAFLILRPNVILLDEPLTAFDVVVAVQIKNLIKSLKNDHIIIFSTHILELAQDLCDEIVVLHNGKLSTLDSSKLHDKDFENEVLAMLTE